MKRMKDALWVKLSNDIGRNVEYWDKLYSLNKYLNQFSPIVMHITLFSRQIIQKNKSKDWINER